MDEPEERITGHTSETSWARPFVRHLCIGYGLDIGCGIEKIVPEAIGVDFDRQYDITVHPRTISDTHCGWEAYLSTIADDSVDYIYSSHLLEDYKEIGSVLLEWIRVIKRGGSLILYLPVEDQFKEHCDRTGQMYNFAHHQNWKNAEDFWHGLSEEIREKLVLGEHEDGIGGYSFLIVARKR